MQRRHIFGSPPRRNPPEFRRTGAVSNPVHTGLPDAGFNLFEGICKNPLELPMIDSWAVPCVCRKPANDLQKAN